VGETLLWSFIGLISIWMLAVGLLAWRGEHRRRAELRARKAGPQTNWPALAQVPKEPSLG
jgi:hypothetical protein